MTLYTAPLFCVVTQLARALLETYYTRAAARTTRGEISGLGDDSFYYTGNSYGVGNCERRSLEARELWLRGTIVNLYPTRRALVWSLISCSIVRLLFASTESDFSYCIYSVMWRFGLLLEVRVGEKFRERIALVVKITKNTLQKLPQS